jgi:hypothetical protein
MSTPTKSPAELAANFQRQLIETAKRCLAMRRHHPNAFCRWRRAARSGPNSELALIFLWRKGQAPVTELWPYARIEELAAAISDQEAYAELARWTGTPQLGETDQ